MLIQMLYWQSVWTQAVDTGESLSGDETNTVAEKSAFARRLAHHGGKTFIHYGRVQKSASQTLDTSIDL